jgi:hypothetical protein
MRESLNRVKNAVAKKDIVPQLTHYTVKNGYVYASDGILTAASPIKCKTDFSVKAAEFQKFLDKTPGEIKIQIQENHFVKVSCGRFRAMVPGSDPSTVNFNLPKGEKVKLTPAFIERIADVRPFISDNATQPWAADAHLRNGCILATNNVVLVRAEGSGIPKQVELSIGYEIVDEILRHPEELQYLVYNENQVAFTWKDGSWMSCQRRVGKMPNTDPIFTLWQETPKVDPEWCESVLHLMDITEGGLTFTHDEMSGRTAKESGAIISSEFRSTLPDNRESVMFEVKFLEPVLKHATHFGFFIAGGPRAAFKTKYSIGIAAGMGK